MMSRIALETEFTHCKLSGQKRYPLFHIRIRMWRHLR